VSSTDLGDGTTLVVVIVRSAGAGPPRVAEARIEQLYITRTAGWKGQTMRRLRPQEVELVELGGMRVSAIILLPHHAHTIHRALVGIQ
jgi:hypothetical protein